jgi:hypothetical protein
MHFPAAELAGIPSLESNLSALNRAPESIKATGDEILQASDTIITPVGLPLSTEGLHLPEAVRVDVAAKVDDIMTSSHHVLENTWDIFAADILPHDIRHGGKTHGGSGLGTLETRIAFKENPGLIEEAVRDRLTEVVGRSNNPVDIQRSSNQNAQDVENGIGFWTLGDLVHSTPARNVEGILGTGLLCSEMHGADAKNDTTPLEVDFSEIVNNVATTSAALGNEQSTYAADRGGNSTVILKFRRDVNAIDYGEESTGNLDSSPSHRTVFVGLPATEISGIQITGQHVEVGKVIDAVIAKGQYIPVYDKDDKLILTPDEFMVLTGKELVTGATAAPEAALEDTKNQVVRMSKRLLGLSKSSQPMESYFSGKIWGSNRRYAETVTDRKGSRAFMNTMQYGDKEEPVSKVSIGLGDGEKMLHVWERANGKLDMFTSSLSGEAAPVTEADLPEVRAELAKSISSMRNNFTEKRAEIKAKSKNSQEDVNKPAVSRRG